LVRSKKVLVLQRSGGVGTYKGKWAGVSGDIEPKETPRARAFREVLEETGLEAENLSLIRVGSPVPIKGTRFLVHPFLVNVRCGRVRIDWEHSRFRWVAPTELARLDTVPGLAEVYASIVDEKRLGAPSTSRKNITIQ
jgi:8-oxo-dGTP pyrophosphatase MutT (NUDIX family)